MWRILCFMVFLISFIGCASAKADPTPTPRIRSGQTAEVVYRLSGSGTAVITYRDDQGNESTVSGARLPWEKTMDWNFRPGKFPFMSAFTNDETALECLVEIDGYGKETNSMPPRESTSTSVTCGLNPFK